MTFDEGQVKNYFLEGGTMKIAMNPIILSLTYNLYKNLLWPKNCLSQQIIWVRVLLPRWHHMWCFIGVKIHIEISTCFTHVQIYIFYKCIILSQFHMLPKCRKSHGNLHMFYTIINSPLLHMYEFTYKSPVFSTCFFGCKGPQGNLQMFPHKIHVLLHM